MLLFFTADVLLRFFSAPSKISHLKTHFFDLIVFIPHVQFVEGIENYSFFTILRQAVIVVMLIGRTKRTHRFVASLGLKPAQLMITSFFFTICVGALLLSLSAFCNAGFSTFSNSLMDFSGDIAVNVVIAVLIILGGLGFVAVRDLYLKVFPSETGSARRRSRLRIQTRIVLTVTVMLVAVGALAVAALEDSLTAPEYSIKEMILVPLARGQSIAEVQIPGAFAGKSLRELDVRKNFKVNVVAIKTLKPAINDLGERELEETVDVVPPIDEKLLDDCILIVAGEDRNIERIAKGRE